MYTNNNIYHNHTPASLKFLKLKVPLSQVTSGKYIDGLYGTWVYINKIIETRTITNDMKIYGRRWSHKYANIESLSSKYVHIQNKYGV